MKYEDYEKLTEAEKESVYDECYERYISGIIDSEKFKVCEPEFIGILEDEGDEILAEIRKRKNEKEG